MFPSIYLLLLLVCFFFPKYCLAQGGNPEEDTLKQIEESKIVISGFVFDEETMNPIAGAIVEVHTVYPRRSAKTTFNGEFTIKGLPLGVHKIVIEAPGYEFKEVHSITLSKDKTTVNLQIQVKKGKTPQEVKPKKPYTVVQPKTNKVPPKISIAPRDIPVNEMAIVSLRSFSNEEMSRFAGSRQDPSRILSNYMGMRTQDDYQNGLVVRGNAPNNFQWRLEGVPMPNPGYLGDFNTTGGLANVFSPRVMQQSDVMLSAFSAQYGNVVGGIFDARLRNQSVDKLTFSGQLNSSTGVEFMMEGNTRAADKVTVKNPDPGYFFINYRLSKFNYLTYLMAHEINSSHTSPQHVPTFQDLSFKVVLPTTAAGEFTFFGLTGMAGRQIDGLKNPAAILGNQFIQMGQQSRDNSIIAVAGAKHRVYLKETRKTNNYIQTTLASTYLQTKQQLSLLNNNGVDTAFFESLNDRKNSIFFSTVFHQKFDQHLTFEGGLQNETILFNLQGKEDVHATQGLLAAFQSNEKSNTNLLQAYTMVLWKPMINFKMNLGMHLQWLSLTNSYTVEPRVAFRWEFVPMHFFSFGYGLHSQMQPLQAYFSRTVLNGTDIGYQGDLNKIGFTRAHHFVIGYDYWIDNDWRFHAELYHEEYFKVPVDSVDKVFSMLNYNGGSLGNISHLTNQGAGYMQGLELSVERYFRKGFYALASASFYTAHYTDFLGRERNISFNNRLILNALAGKTIPFGAERQHTVNIDMRVSYGGRRYSDVVNSIASIAANQTIYEASTGSSRLTRPYFRSDLKIGVTLQNTEKKQAHTFFIDAINLTGAQNTNGQYFDRATQTVKEYRQLPFFFDFGYQFKF